MKKLLMLLVLLALAGAAGYIYWERNAKQVEAVIADGITRLNAEIKAQAGVVAIAYESLSLTGFPYAITLQLKNPLIRLPLSRWIRNENQAQPWVEEHQFQGILKLSADWKVSKFTLTLPTAHRSQTLINGKPYFPRIGQAEEPINCSLSLDMVESFEHLWQPQKMLAVLAENPALLRALECEVEGYREVSEEAGNAPHQQVQQMNFSLQIDEAEPKNTYRLNLETEVKQYQAFAAQDAYFGALLQRFPALAAQLTHQQFGLHALAFLGQQNLRLKSEYHGAWPSAAPALHQDMSLNLSQFHLDNALGNYDSTLQLKNAPLEGGTKRDIRFDADIRGTISSVMENLYRQRFVQALQQKPMILGYNVFFINTALLRPDQMPLLAADLYPRLNALSPLALQVKGKAELIPAAQAGALPSYAKLMLENLLLQTPEWQASLSGALEYQPIQLLPTIEATLRLKEADALFRQFSAKLAAMEKWRQQQSYPPAVMITDGFLKDMHRMVEAIAQGKQENPSAEIAPLGNPQFQITFKNFMPRINGLDINQIMLLFNELLSVHLQSSVPENNGMIPPAGYQR